MSNEKVRVILAVDPTEAEAGAKRAARAIRDVEDATTKTGKASEDAASKAKASAEAQQAAAGKVGNSLMLVGAAAVGAAALATKSASDWESAYAGVRKTVNGSAKEMAVLEGQLRNIAKVAPASHAEIAGVAEAAGQLGVAREDVAKFAKVMIDLGVTTNITAQDAAMSIRQFMNIMGSAPESVDRIGAAIVGLGNNSATTENDIMMMAHRLAGAGKQMGLTEAQVLGTAAAMASVGIEAEAGGTAMSLTWKQIDAAVRKGGANLITLGEIAGVSGDQFAQAWGTDAAGATDLLVRGLGRMQSEGKNVNGVLAELGIKGIRQTDTLIRLAGATKAMGAETDLLSKSLRIGTEEFARNTALQNEAAQRYGTTAEKAKIAANKIQDNLIGMGQALLPIANQGIQVISDLATAFGALPAPIQGGITGIMGLVGILALSAGGAIKFSIAVDTAKASLAAMGTSMGTVALKGGAIGLALTGVALIIGHYAGQAAEARQTQDDLTAALQQTNGQLRDQNGIIHESIRAIAAKKLEEKGVLETAQRLGIDLGLVTEAYLGNADAARQVKDAVMEANRVKAEGAGIDEAAAQEVAVYAKRNLEIVYAVKAGADATDKSVEATKRQIEAQHGSAAATDASAEASKRDAKAKQEVADATARARKEIRDLIDASLAAANAQFAMQGSQLAVNSAMLNATETLRKNNYETSASTEKGIANRQALISLGQAIVKNSDDMAKNGKSIADINAANGEAIAKYEELAKKLGMSTEEVNILRDAITRLPATVETDIVVDAFRGTRDVADWKDLLASIPPEKMAQLRAAAAQNDVAAVERILNNAARDRTAMIKVLTVQPGGPSNYSYEYARAAGGIMEYYGLGGVRDAANRHIAEIAPAGAYRVWAEPETHGEAYIPLANDWRRGRAEAILREVARRFGMHTYATGGINAPQPSPVPSSINIGPISVVAQGATASEVASEISVELRRNIRAAIPGLVGV